MLLLAELSLFAWPPTNLWQAIAASAAFGFLGIFLAIVGFKIFDLLTPGNLQAEVLAKGNVAAAILGGSFIVGICLIVASVVG